jgi:hypothetical protein
MLSPLIKQGGVGVEKSNQQSDRNMLWLEIYPLMKLLARVRDGDFLFPHCGTPFPPFLIFFDQGITSLLPGRHPTSHSFSVEIAECIVFCCLTGSSVFLRSGAIEDDLLAFLQRGELCFEFT